MNYNQKGFGIVEVIIILCVILCIGFIGWYLLTNTMPRTSNTNQAVSEQSADHQSKSRQDVTPPKGYSLYKNDTYDFSFIYPQDWEIKTPETSGGMKNSNVSFHAPFTVVENLPQVGSSLRSGATLGVSVAVGSNPDTQNDTEAISRKQLTVDGQQAVQVLTKYNPYGDARSGYDEYRNTITFQAGEDFKSSEPNLSKGVRYFSIGLSTSENPESSSYSQVLDDVIKSFRVGQAD